jgi:hypothetical protein
MAVNSLFLVVIYGNYTTRRVCISYYNLLPIQRVNVRARSSRGSYQHVFEIREIISNLGKSTFDPPNLLTPIGTDREAVRTFYSMTRPMGL